MTRCNCTTKSGTRCKRSAMEDSEYCYVHQGCANVYKSKQKQTRKPLAGVPFYDRTKFKFCLKSEERAKECLNHFVSRNPELLQYITTVIERGPITGLIQENGVFVAAIDKDGSVLPLETPIIMQFSEVKLPITEMTDELKEVLNTKRDDGIIVGEDEREEIIAQIGDIKDLECKIDEVYVPSIRKCVAIPKGMDAEAVLTLIEQKRMERAAAKETGFLEGLEGAIGGVLGTLGLVEEETVDKVDRTCPEGEIYSDIVAGCIAAEAVDETVGMLDIASPKKEVVEMEEVLSGTDELSPKELLFLPENPKVLKEAIEEHPRMVRNAKEAAKLPKNSFKYLMYAIANKMLMENIALPEDWEEWTPHEDRDREYVGKQLFGASKYGPEAIELMKLVYSAEKDSDEAKFYGNQMRAYMEKYDEYPWETEFGEPTTLEKQLDEIKYYKPGKTWGEALTGWFTKNQPEEEKVELIFDMESQLERV